MSTYKTDENITHNEFHNYNKTVFIAAYIKYIMLVTHIIYRTEILFHLSKCVPLSIFNSMIPPFKRSLSLLMSRLLVEFLECPM